MDFSAMDGVELKRTCIACPEQYDMLLNGELVGYFRLRFGCYTVTVRPWTDSAREVISELYGDAMTGVFDTDDDRDFYLYRGVVAVLNRLGKER